MFASAYPFLEELRLKRMTVSDESLEYLARSFPGFKALSLVSCDGFSTNGLASIARYCRNLVELDIQENAIDDLGGSWLSCFPESFTSLEVLNFANINSEVSFDALERLVARCKSLKVLKVNKNVSLEQLQMLLIRVPHLTELGTGSFSQDHMVPADAQLESVFSKWKNLRMLSGLWAVSSLFLPVLYPACSHLSFLNLSYAPLQSTELAKFLPHCRLLRRLWVIDTVEDKGLKAVGSSCPLLEELRPSGYSQQTLLMMKFWMEVTMVLLKSALLLSQRASLCALLLSSDDKCFCSNCSSKLPQLHTFPSLYNEHV